MKPGERSKCWSCRGPAVEGRPVRRGVDMVTICRGCRVKQVEDLYLDHGQADALLRAAEGLGPRCNLFTFIGLHLGTRVSEATALKGDAVRPDQSLVWIRTLKRKGRPVLPVYTSPDVMRGLVRLVDGRAGYLFPRLTSGRDFLAGGHVSRWSGERLFKAAAAAAGLSPRLSAHSMRHYMATATLEATGDIWFTSRQLRHKSVRTTERYLHLLPGQARQQAASVPAVGAPR